MLTQLLSVIILGQIQTDQATSPVPSLGSNEAFQSGVKAVATHLAAAEFAAAAQRAKNLPQDSFTIGLDASSTDQRTQTQLDNAVNQSIAAWQKAIPALKITLAKKPSLKIAITPKISEPNQEEKSMVLFASPDPTEPALEAVIALNRTSRNVPIDPALMLAEVNFAIGSYLGLERSPISTSTMFRHEGLGFRVGTIDAESAAIARSNLAQAKQLREFITKKTKIQAAFPEAFIAEKTVELGRFTQGEPKDFQIEIVNRGDAPLNYGIKPDCSCFLLSYSGQVAPRSVDVVTARMNSKDFQGGQLKGLYIYTNDAASPVTRVNVTADIIPAYRLVNIEKKEEFSITPNGLKTSFLIYGGGKLPFEPRKASIEGSSAIADITPWEGEVEDPLLFPGKQRVSGYKVDILVAPNIPNGKNLLALLIRTDSEEWPVIGANFFVQKGIAITPGSIFFGDVTQKTVQATVQLAGLNSDFQITRVETQPGFRAEFAKITDKIVRLIVEFTPEKNKGTIVSTVIVHTNDPENPKVSIPIQAYVP